MYQDIYISLYYKMFTLQNMFDKKGKKYII